MGVKVFKTVKMVFCPFPNVPKNIVKPSFCWGIHIYRLKWHKKNILLYSNTLKHYVYSTFFHYRYKFCTNVISQRYVLVQMKFVNNIFSSHFFLSKANDFQIIVRSLCWQVLHLLLNWNIVIVLLILFYFRSELYSRWRNHSEGCGWSLFFPGRWRHT